MKLKPGVQTTYTDYATIYSGHAEFHDDTRTIVYPEFNESARIITIRQEVIENEKEYFKRKLMGK